MDASVPLFSPARPASARGASLFALGVLFGMTVSPQALTAQVSAVVSGTVTDRSHALVTGASVTVKSVEAGVLRNAATDGYGHYQVFSVPVGQYEIRVQKSGFRDELRTGVQLFVGQAATLDFELQVGESTNAVTVKGDAPLVSVAPNDISGLVSPAAGSRSAAERAQLRRTADAQPGRGQLHLGEDRRHRRVELHQRQQFRGFGKPAAAESVPAERRGIHRRGGKQHAAGRHQPGTAGRGRGARVQRAARFLRRRVRQAAGRAGSDRDPVRRQPVLHGSLYEFLRNNAFDARNFFDPRFGAGLSAQPVRRPRRAAPFRRTRLSCSPTTRDSASICTRPAWTWCRTTTRATVTCLASSGQPGAEPLPVDRAGVRRRLAADQSAGRRHRPARRISAASPKPSTTRCRPSATISARCAWTTSSPARIRSARSTPSTTAPISPPPAPMLYSTDVESLREQVASLEETHVFSPTLLNTARIGFSRAGYFFTGEPTPGTPAASLPGFCPETRSARWWWAAARLRIPPRSSASRAATTEAICASRAICSPMKTACLWSAGRHQITAGVWFQRLRSNEILALSQYGQATFTSLQTLLQGTVATLLYDPAPTPLGWRSWFGAVHAQDTIRLSPSLTLSLGFRDEFTTGWNEAHGRASTYTFVGRHRFRPQPRGRQLGVHGQQRQVPAAAARRPGVEPLPERTRTVIRAGLRHVQRSCRTRWATAPIRTRRSIPTYSLPSVPVSQLPVSDVGRGACQPPSWCPAACSRICRRRRWSPGRSGCEQELTANTALTVGYVGSHGYHELLGIDANEPFPVICPGVALSGELSGQLSRRHWRIRRFRRELIMSPPPPRANPALANTWTYFSEADSSYQALQVDCEPPLQPRPLCCAAYTPGRRRSTTAIR